MIFEAAIGLEIHIELQTNSKMFSSAPISHKEKPNTNVNPLDIGFPGALPSINKQAVIYAIELANIFHMSIDRELWFDRKNYFYSDLAKGYQITQHYRPIGKDGYLDIDGLNINIKEIHLEEDTAKQIHQDDTTLIDYNRSGIPLIEVVTNPDIHTGEEAKNFLRDIHQIVTRLGISDGKMENGSLRCDVNISLRPIGKSEYGQKVEIKNLNSFENVEAAIDFEISRQMKLYLSGKEISQETRRYDERNKETVFLRAKQETSDYHYIIDTNIAPVVLSEELINEAIRTSNLLLKQDDDYFKHLGLSESEIGILLSDNGLIAYFDALVKNGASPQLSAKWLNVNVQTILKKNNIDIREFPIPPYQLAELLIFIENGKISNNQARLIFDKMLVSGKSASDIIMELDINTLDEEKLNQIIYQVILDNPQAIIDYQKGKTRVIGYLAGQVMKKTNGQVNPKILNEKIVEQLKGK